MPQSQMIQSLLRGLDVLALLAECSDGMALKDVAGALDVKPPTAHNLLRTLCARGFARNDGGRYRVGPALQELAGKSRKGGLREKAEAAMRQVAEAFPEGRITFDEFSGGELRAVLRMSPDLPRMVQHPENLTFPPYTSISGLVWQAFAEEESLLNLRLEKPFWEHGFQLWQSPERLESFLSEIRARGWGMADFDPNGFRGAAPVFNSSSKLQAVLGLSVFPEKHPTKKQCQKWGAQLRDWASQISKS